MVAYVVYAVNFKSEFRSDLQGCLEVTVASKPHFLCWSLIVVEVLCFLIMNLFFQNSSKNNQKSRGAPLLVRQNAHPCILGKIDCGKVAVTSRNLED